MAPLIGRHINKIDRKGRVSVPKSFRDAFAGQEFPGIYVFPSFKAETLEACGSAYMSWLAKSVDDLDLFSNEQDELAAIILENAHPLGFDPEGRVTLPRELLDYAHLDTQAAFVGRGSRFQIWEPEAHERQRRAAFESARKRGATLKLRRGEAEAAP